MALLRKVRITEPQALQKQLADLGIACSGDSTIKDTYFKQPEGVVLKISEEGQGAFLVRQRIKNRAGVTGRVHA